MSIKVVGFCPPNEKWHKMKALYDACAALNIDQPNAVDAFFNYEPPNKLGSIIDQDNLKDAIKGYSDDMEDGYEIEIAKLPKDVTHIRIYDSY